MPAFCYFTPRAAYTRRCCMDRVTAKLSIFLRTNGEYLDLDKYSVFWERASALEAPIYLHPGNPFGHPATYAIHSELSGPVAVGPLRGRRARYAWCSPASSNATPRQGSFSVMVGRHCLSASGALTAAGRFAIEEAGRLLTRPPSTFGATSPSPRPVCAPTIRCAARSMRWALRT